MNTRFFKALAIFICLSWVGLNAHTTGFTTIGGITFFIALPFGIYAVCAVIKETLSS